MMQRRIGFPMRMILCACCLLIGTLIARQMQNGRLEQTQISIHSISEQIGQIETRLAAVDSSSLPSLEPSLIWGIDTAQLPEQAIQSWVLDALRRYQQDIRQYAQTSPMNSFEVPSASLRLEFSGPLSGLVAFLKETELHRPALAVSNLQIRALPAREQHDGQTYVTTQITVWGLVHERP